MEPFRPLVDLTVVRLVANGVEDVTPESKLELAILHTRTLLMPSRSPVVMVVQRFVGSVARVFESGQMADLGDLLDRGGQLESFTEKMGAAEIEKADATEN
jgi:hypothetical protein